MRDYPDEIMVKADTDQREDAAEPRGRDALGLSPKGLFHDFVLEPMKGRGVDVVYKATTVFLTLATGAVLVMALLAA
ncbi:hypothetical protein [Rubrimonas cliftonensis]|uniref:Uncharacterized protein n=1 Tax=Rubrimonas cliftonensis TaxID=89524 RepID=A0A1H3Z4U8_9RHOB|nr:hypothetical protein [Rubrimonas cliftonensis]SEA18725.1 hypothetical protein SAMN05444370_103392 [Rubrimonas cliftonensis]